MFHVSYCNLEFSSYFPEIFFEEEKNSLRCNEKKAKHLFAHFYRQAMPRRANNVGGFTSRSFILRPSSPSHSSQWLWYDDDDVKFTNLLDNFLFSEITFIMLNPVQYLVG